MLNIWNRKKPVFFANNFRCKITIAWPIKRIGVKNVLINWLGNQTVDLKKLSHGYVHGRCWLGFKKDLIVGCKRGKRKEKLLRKTKKTRRI